MIVLIDLAVYTHLEKNIYTLLTSTYSNKQSNMCAYIYAYTYVFMHPFDVYFHRRKD